MLEALLAKAILAIIEYRKTRDEVQAKADPTDPNSGAVRSDEELIALLKGESIEAQDFIAGLIAKHGG